MQTTIRRCAPSRRTAACRGGKLAARRAGFSLIEILAVIVIIGILMAVLLPRLLGAAQTSKEQLTRSFLQQLGGAIDDYERDRAFGDFPPSTWPETWGTAPNTTNVGAEALVQALWSNQWGGTVLSDQYFTNSDEDESKKALGKLPTPKLFELRDEWDNPIAYIHRRDYQRQHPYVSLDTESSEPIEGLVTGVLNPETKAFYNPNKYQLISAGADGRFGTEDDLGNWTAEARD
jgi:prepilin-type N-terminal cleavage/methylation domain-containing protein